MPSGKCGQMRRRPDALAMSGPRSILLQVLDSVARRPHGAHALDPRWKWRANGTEGDSPSLGKTMSRGCAAVRSWRGGP